MYIKGSFLGLILFLNGLFSLAQAQAQAQDKDKVLSIDTFIPYVSTVPANKDQIVGLHLRERVLESTQKIPPRGPSLRWSYLSMVVSHLQQLRMILTTKIFPGWLI